MKRLNKEQEMLARLDTYTTEYLAMEQLKAQYYRDHINDRSRTAILTLYHQQIRIDTLVKQICLLVDRLMDKDIDFTNETAVMVYNYFSPQIKIGLFKDRLVQY